MKNHWSVVLGCLLMHVWSNASLAQEAQPARDSSLKYSDDKFDFSIAVSPPWKSAKLQDYAVPGVARAAYASTDGASIVVFVQEPGKDFTPRFLVDQSVQGIEQGLGATVKVKEVRNVAGKQAMWMVVQGQGTGGAIDGKGEVLTMQHWIAIPREKDIVVVLLTSPATAYEQHAKSFNDALKTLKVGGKQTATQSNSK